jgi:hypothetical protein
MNRLVRLPGRGMAAMAIAGLLTLATIAATPAAASASTTLKVRYPVNGSTFLKAPNATVTLGPGTLRSAVNLSTGKVTASLNPASHRVVQGIRPDPGHRDRRLHPERADDWKGQPEHRRGIHHVQHHPAGHQPVGGRAAGRGRPLV